MMCHCSCAMRFLRKFLLLFWTVWWGLALVTNFIGTAHFWGWFHGVAGKNYEVLHTAIKSFSHGIPFLTSVVLLLILLAQAWVVFYFLRGVLGYICQRNHNCTNDVSAYSFALCLLLLLMFFGLEWLMFGHGVDTHSMGHMITCCFLPCLSFFSLIFSMLESKCCQC